MDDRHPGEPGIRQTISDDFSRGDFWDSLRQDWRELKEFFISADRKDRLKDMGAIKKWFYIPFWLLKSLFYNLSPARRILFLFSFIFLIAAGDKENGGNWLFLSGFIIFFILMLELKDKLLAKNELAVGRSVQAALMPEEQPVVDGWELWLITKPANDVGGDIVDFFELNNETRYLVLSDISGKGLGAALLAAKLQATVRAIVPRHSSLVDLAERVNAIFIRDTMPKTFASMIYLEFRKGSGKIDFINAGHMPPYFIKNGEISKFEKGGPALGILKNAPFTDTVVEMESGDTLFLYSDGVTEAMNDEGHFFGETRLERILKHASDKAPKYLGNYILRALDDFVLDAPAHDDVSMVILKRK